MTQEPPQQDPAQEEDRRRRWILWLLLLLLLLLLGVCFVVVSSGDGEDSASDSTETAAPTTDPPPETAAPTTQPPATTSTSTTTTTLPPEAAVIGTWVFEVHVTGVDGSVCQGEIGDIYEREVTISGTGDSMVVVGLDNLNDPDDPPWVGTFEDGQLTVEGSRAEDDGVTNATFIMMLSEDGTSLEGEEAWTWDWTSQGQTGTCVNGTSTVTAVKAP